MPYPLALLKHSWPCPQPDKQKYHILLFAPLSLNLQDRQKLIIYLILSFTDFTLNMWPQLLFAGYIQVADRRLNRWVSVEIFRVLSGVAPHTLLQANSVFSVPLDGILLCLPSQSQTHPTPLLWAPSDHRGAHKSQLCSQSQAFCVIGDGERAGTAWSREGLGGTPPVLLAASESPSPSRLILFCFLPSSHHPLVQSHSHHAPLPPGIPLPWSPPWPAPSLLEHSQGGLFSHHLEVW